MGYTHYWTIVNADPSAWGKFRNATERVITAVQSKGIRIAGPLGTGRHDIETAILLNGAEPDAYESFVLDPADGWTFCKTARRPYDLSVVAILVLAEHYGILRATSDGEPHEWTAGLALAQTIEASAKLPAGVTDGETEGAL